MRLFGFRKRRPLSREDGNASSDFSYVMPKPVLDETLIYLTWSVPPFRSENTKSSLPPLEEINVPVLRQQSFNETITKLIDDVATANELNGKKATRALRKLFSMSEPGTMAPPSDPKTVMVRIANGRLVPVLFNFIERCVCEGNRQHNRSAEYLALLVLNSISIPVDNKRLIALNHNGATLLSRLLQEDPECHMAAIILTNLTFAIKELRNELIIAESTHKLQLIATLSYVLRLSSSTKIEYLNSQNLFNFAKKSSIDVLQTAQELLSPLLAYDEISNPEMGYINKIPTNKEQLYPETARWCLCTIQNLTMPSKESHLAVHSLIRTGILPHIVRFITIQTETIGSVNMNTDESNPHNSSSDSSENLLESYPPTDLNQNDMKNPPSCWSSQLPEDTALFIMLNIATVSSAIDYMLHETRTVYVLIRIIRYYEKLERCSSNFIIQSESDDKQMALFQCLKARITLAYLLGAYGHFGQRKRARTLASKIGSLPDLNTEEPLLISGKAEVICMIELVANTLHKQSKAGSGGYLAVMFNIKYVLFALRCLLTQYKNQIIFGQSNAVMKLNTLLLKIIALYVFKPVDDSVDSEAAEYACFSLYLLSSFGFKSPFMPFYLRNSKDIANSIVAKVLYAYKQKTIFNSPGKHSATQLLLRLNFLIFDGSVPDIDDTICIDPTNFIFDKDLLNSIEEINVIGEVYHGAEPLKDIFDRSIYGFWKPNNNNNAIIYSKNNENSLHNNFSLQKNCNEIFYISVLHAVQDISYGNKKYQHLVWEIDEIHIANTIVIYADSFIYNEKNVKKNELYNHIWRWYKPSNDENLDNDDYNNNNNIIDYEGSVFNKENSIFPYHFSPKKGNGDIAPSHTTTTTNNNNKNSFGWNDFGMKMISCASNDTTIDE